MMKTWLTTNNQRIIRMPNARCNCYLVIDGSNAILVDTSVKRRRNELYNAVNQIVMQNNCTLRAIVLTHNHFDHIGNAAFLSEQFNCDILIHSHEYDEFVTGQTRIPTGLRNPQKWITRKIAKLNDKGKFLSFQKFEVPDTKRITPIGDYFDLNSYGINAKIILTEGHTAGSVSVIAGDVALVGDTMVRTFWGDMFPPFANFPERIISSWNMLLATGCKTFLPAHGDENRIKELELIFAKQNERQRTSSKYR